MNHEERTGPGEAAGDGRARHGYQNEVNWDGGKGGQPYANQDAALGPAAAHETEAGNRGAASGRNLQQMEELKRKPAPPVSEAPRDETPDDGARR